VLDDLKRETTLVTGAAGFIGFHVARRILEAGGTVLGVDNLNPYYDVELKKARLERLRPFKRFRFVNLDLAARVRTEELFEKQAPRRVVHLAAQAGVRYSVTHPHVYVESNITGFLHVLEGCRRAEVEHLVFASSSSVYGGNTRLPYSEHQPADHPISLYAATKKANELMAHAYAHLYGIPCTGLRFFTVYGPWGRPDMALFKFTKGILEGTPIPLFGAGQLVRDYTFIDDVVEGVVRILDIPARPNAAWQGDAPDPATSRAPYRIFNVGNSRPIHLERYVEVLELCLGRKAVRQLLPEQPGDVPATLADVNDLAVAVGFRPATPLEVGIARFVEWYREYYGIGAPKGSVV
jgi:UDP-glucuronate 4-epimerase